MGGGVHRCFPLGRPIARVGCCCSVSGAGQAPVRLVISWRYARSNRAGRIAAQGVEKTRGSADEVCKPGRPRTGAGQRSRGERAIRWAGVAAVPQGPEGEDFREQRVSAVGPARARTGREAGTAAGRTHEGETRTAVNPG
ncbi:hypothetical protein OH686_18410 [Pseudomonas sp. SO81]|nr:hypothetical protein OH686_18410 [Pseudomonas sp. SO81]